MPNNNQDQVQALKAMNVPPSVPDRVMTPVETAPTPVVEYPKDLYDEAHIENGHRDFNNRLMASRTPDPKPYVPPVVPPGIQRTTNLEMAAGKARVEQFQQIESARQKIAHRTPEKWEGSTTPVFRPADFEEYKTTLKSPTPTQSKDAGLRQPSPRA